MNEIIYFVYKGINNNGGDEQMNQIREQLGSTIQINQGVNQRNNNMQHQGFIDSIKREENVQILALNPQGFRPDNKEKINMIK